MQTAQPVQATRWQHPQMLQVALAPASVPFGEVDKRGRAFFIAASEVRDQIHLPTSAAQQGSFHKVMAQDMPSKRGLPWEFWQASMLRERPGAYDGIMAPIATITAMPVGHARGNNRTVDARRKLLQARKQGVAVDHQR